MDPWYHAGLRFECTRCGNCCTGAPGYVWLDAAEVDAIASFLGEPRDEFLAVYTRVAHRGRTLRERADGDCTFYKRGQGCTIYPVRPKQCRTWPFWDSNLRTPLHWQQAGDGCPGVGSGPLIAADEITRRLNEIEL